MCTILFNLLQNICLFISSYESVCYHFFLLNLVNNWICNWNNSIVLFVALPHLLEHRLMWWDCNKFGFNYSDYTTILEFHLNLKKPMPKAYLFLIVAKMLLQKANINSKFIIINLLIFVVWIIEIYGSLDCLTSCSINKCGEPTTNWDCFSYSHYTTSYLILVAKTSKQAKLSVSCSKNFAAETKYQLYFIESWTDFVVWT